ncbi:MAG TPA: hypothetical protein VGQ44_05530 [Gemmatimonadaceae bacterium]|jgi:hypothetical protein|nr:hypothetical protein [Gemmatimonadaceae bacterium]
MKKLLVFLALFAAACASTPSATPEQRIAAVEQRLDKSSQWSMAFNTTTTGAVESRFTGTMNVLPHNFASIDADGFMRGQPAHIRWEASGSPSEVSHALSIGVVRLGITHDLATLAAGAKTIDNAEGGIDQSLKMTNLAWDAQNKKFTYHIVVDGQDSGTGELRVGRGDMPRSRVLDVKLPNGMMHVEEHYEWR